MAAKPMKPSPDTAISLRLPAALLRRADGLITFVAASAVAGGETRISRSMVLRHAIEVGIEELERRARKAR
jgi:hypothetical protein